MPLHLPLPPPAHPPVTLLTILSILILLTPGVGETAQAAGAQQQPSTIRRVRGSAGARTARTQQYTHPALPPTPPCPAPEPALRRPPLAVGARIGGWPSATAPSAMRRNGSLAGVCAGAQRVRQWAGRKVRGRSRALGGALTCAAGGQSKKCHFLDCMYVKNERACANQCRKLSRMVCVPCRMRVVFRP